MMRVIMKMLEYVFEEPVEGVGEVGLVLGECVSRLLRCF